MFEELFFALGVVVVMAAIVAYSFLRNRLSEEELMVRASSAKERLLIAERKFMQGKIRKGVFEALVDSLEEELLGAELSLFRMHKAPTVSVGEKVEKIFAVLKRPTPYRKAKLNLILKEAELLRHEMSLLEGKLLKREVTQGLFEKLIAQKESQLIQKEKELADIVAKSAE